MARKVANVDIITDSFEIWLLETNELLNALSTEIMTANATYANTGNSTFDRTAQLYGTFGANNLVVSNWLKGGNVNSLFANLMVSTNTVLSNTNAANIQFAVSNSSSNSYMNPLGVYLGLGTANSFVNSTAIITQNGSVVNTNISPTLIQIANSTSTANINPTSFKTGIFQANTIEVQVGANVVANATSLYLGNSTINAVHTQAQSTLANSVHSTLITQEKIRIGNSTINALANSTLITIANSTSSANVDPISFKTGIFQANTIEVQVGANVIANSTALYIGNATINAVHTQTSTILQNSVHSATLTLTKLEIGNSTINTIANSTILKIANSTSSANIDPISFKTGIFTGNTTAVSVGANVVANSTALYIGNATINTVATQTTTTIANATHNTTLGISAASFGNSTANTTHSQTLIQAANSTVTSNVTTAGFVTGIFTANQTVVSVGANVYANATTLYVGNSTASIAHGNNTITGSANIGIVPTSYLNVTGALTVSSNTALSNTLVVTGNTTLSNTLAVTGNTRLSNTLAVTGNTTLSNTLAVTGLTTLSGNMNTPTANASVAVNVGANVTLDITGGGVLQIGDKTLTIDTLASMSSDALVLADQTSEASNSFSHSVTKSQIRNQKSWVNLATNVRDVSHLSRTEFYIVSTEDVFVNANNAGKIYANTTVLRISNTTVNSEISTAQIRVGANVYANTTTLYVGNSTASIAHGNNTIVGSANIGITVTNYLNVTGALTVSSNVALSNTLTVTGNTTLSNTLAVTGNTTLSNTLAVTGAVTLSNTLTVTGNTNLSDYVTFDNDYAIQVESNTNLGATTGSNLLVYTFPKTTFSSAKMTVQVKNTGNTQISEMVLAHDGTDAYLTVFGTVASPGFANNNVNPLATFAANVNGANIELLINQSRATSAAKIIAHLIK
jgi:filamentous hemagglutinin